MKPEDMQPPSTSPDDTGEATGAGMMAEAHQDGDTMGDSGEHPDMMSEPHTDRAMTENAPPDHMRGSGSE